MKKPGSVLMLGGVPGLLAGSLTGVFARKYDTQALGMIVGYATLRCAAAGRGSGIRCRS